ncbi:MAG: DUF3604 domain-containing protein [Bryobacteraceae bacterium]
MTRSLRYLLLGSVLLPLLIRNVDSQDPAGGGYRSYAKYSGEEEAARRAEQLGLGKATLEGPSEVVAGGLGEFVLRFTVGRAGMRPGGGVRLAHPHGLGTDWGGLRLQTDRPSAENYLSWSTSSEATVEWTPVQVTAKQLFSQYHPWQLINEFKVLGKPLAPGDWIEIRLGDRRQGSPGVQIQRYDETAFQFKFYVDAGDGEYLPLAKNPSVKITGGEAAELHVNVPSVWERGKPGWVQVWAGDRYGNPAESYRGVVKFETGGALGGLPLEYRFQAADGGARRFENVSSVRPGTFRIRVRQTNNGMSAESNPFIVHAEAAGKIYWGDIHTHTMYSDGRGAPAETYDFAKRVSAVDFAAVSDHSFLTTDRMWREIVEVTNRFYQPNRFVTFVGYEWSGLSDVGGDHNVYTSDPEMPIVRCYSYFNNQNLRMYRGPDQGANHVEELFRILGRRFRNENILVIPHFGGRPGNPAWHNPQLQRQIEIFSDHRRSEDWATKFLEKGYRVGIMASTDNHSGNAGYGVRFNPVERGEEGELFSRTSPAERGTALVAAYADGLTRDSVFQALYHRRTYATTGSRILLRFEVNGAPMGSEIQLRESPAITASVEGTAEIQTVRIVKNGRVVHAIAPGGRSARVEYRDNSGDYAKKFYYVDVVQVDGEKAISSPVWVN